MANRNQNVIIQGEKKLILTKVRPKTELEEIKELFPDYDKTELNAEYDLNGNIISIETENSDLINILKLKGFVES